MIWDPEANEIADLKYFVDLDRELYHNGHLPHFVDILELERLPEFLLRFDSGVRAVDALVEGIRSAYDRLVMATRR